jgi:hypothetical protein
MEKLISKLKDKEFLKGISTVIGASLLNFIAGAIFSVSQLLLYEVSYIHHVNPGNEITSDNESFYYPIEIFLQTIATFFSAVLYKKLGLNYTNLIGMVTLFFGYLALLLSKSFAVDVISMILGGIGTGIINYPSTANACEWFLDNNGIIVGIIETMISLGSFCFNLLGEKIINPKKAKAIKEDDDAFHSLEISEKFKTFMIWLIISVVVFYGLSYVMTFKKQNDIFKDPSKMKVGLIQVNDENGNKEENKDSDGKQSGIEATFEYEEEKKDILKMLFSALKSINLIIFTLIVVLEAPISSMIFSLSRSIGEFNEIDELTSLGPINFVFECVGGFFLGILCDYVPQKYLLLFMNGSNVIIAFFYCLTFSNSIAFFIFTSYSSFLAGGFYSIKDYFLIKVYGVDLYVELMACVNLLASIVVIGLTPLSYYLNDNADADSNSPYWILFSICGVLSIMGLVLSYYVKDDVFKYEKPLADDDDDDGKEINKLDQAETGET